MSLTTPRTTALRTAAVLAAAAVALTACGSGGPSGAAGAAGPSAADDKIPTTDVVSGVRKDPAAAKLLPADVRARGSLSSPPASAPRPARPIWPTARPWPARTSTSRMPSARSSA